MKVGIDLGVDGVTCLEPLVGGSPEARAEDDGVKGMRLAAFELHHVPFYPLQCRQELPKV